MKFNEILPADKVRNMNHVVMEFVGDAVYTLYVREKVVSSGDYKTGALNKMAAQTVCASAQARLAEQISTFFTEAENDVFRRARNAKKTSRAKNASVADYNASTGFEAVIGYLYLTGNYARLDELLALKD